MGQDKGLIHFLGEPLILRTIRRLRPLADELLVVTNHPEQYEFLKIPLFNDRIPGRGALGGLYTALSAASQPLAAVVACDMPFANASLLAALRDRVLESGADAALPRSPQGIEPFHSIYRPAACLPLIQAALEADRWRVDSWFDLANILYIDPEEIERYDPRRLAFINLNTPADLSEAEALARQIEPDRPDSDPVEKK